MLNKLFGRKRYSTNEENLVRSIVTETSALINDLHRQMDLRFKELSTQIRELELGLEQMETKLLSKDLKDKQAYGILHYKLHEVKNAKLESEIEKLQNALAEKKSNLKDH